MKRAAEQCQHTAEFHKQTAYFLQYHQVFGVKSTYANVMTVAVDMFSDKTKSIEVDFKRPKEAEKEQEN